MDPIDRALSLTEADQDKLLNSVTGKRQAINGERRPLADSFVIARAGISASIAWIISMALGSPPKGNYERAVYLNECQKKNFTILGDYIQDKSCELTEEEKELLLNQVLMNGYGYLPSKVNLLLDCEKMADQENFEMIYSAVQQHFFLATTCAVSALTYPILKKAFSHIFPHKDKVSDTAKRTLPVVVATPTSIALSYLICRSVSSLFNIGFPNIQDTLSHYNELYNKGYILTCTAPLWITPAAYGIFKLIEVAKPYLYGKMVRLSEYLESPGKKEIRPAINNWV